MLEINNVVCGLKANVLLAKKQPHKFPYVVAYKEMPTSKPDAKLLDDGWILDGKSYHYNDNYVYHKLFDIRNLISDVDVFFTKTTDERDINEFGFKDKKMEGVYRFKLPDVMIKNLAKDFFDSKRISERNKNEIKAFVPSDIEDKEFELLREFRDEHRSALSNVIKEEMSEEELENVIVKVSNDIRIKFPVFLQSCGNSRSRAILSGNIRNIYNMLGKEYPLTMKMRY